MRRLTLAVLFFACACISAPPTRPSNREWQKLLAEYNRLEAIREARPRPAVNASRKDRIEVLLETLKTIEPLYVPLLEGLREYYERTGDVRAAELYAGEKVRIGDEYMEVLSRYDRAISMYQGALAIAPDHAAARTRLRIAEERRFVSIDAFAKLKAGMSVEQVRGLVGSPREDWIKQVVQKNRVYSVWIFPKKDGGAAAIYFDNGVVYYTNWNAGSSQAGK